MVRARRAHGHNRKLYTIQKCNRSLPRLDRHWKCPECLAIAVTGAAGFAATSTATVTMVTASPPLPWSPPLEKALKPLRPVVRVSTGLRLTTYLGIFGSSAHPAHGDGWLGSGASVGVLQHHTPGRGCCAAEDAKDREDWRIPTAKDNHDGVSTGARCHFADHPVHCTSRGRARRRCAHRACSRL